MISNLRPHKLIYRDGTSQEDRHLEALSPDYVQIEERNIEDLIRHAQHLAKELNFFDQHNNISSNWEALFIDDIEDYRKKTETGKEIQRKGWVKELAAYIDNPSRFENDQEKTAKLSKPQLVLFLSFLQLLNHIKAQLNTITKKHLDFYFLEALGLTKKEAKPDMVNVLIEVADNSEQVEVNQGTLLKAGKDEEGNDLLYKTDHDTVVSKANIENLKTVYVEKKTITLRDARIDNIDDEDNGFTKMMELALGDPSPGDALPGFPDGATSLLKVQENLSSPSQDTLIRAELYIQTSLYLSIDDFNFIILIHLNDSDPKKRVEDDDWETIYDLLDQAYKDKIRLQRQNVLKDIREKELDSEVGFEKLLKFTLGKPEAYDDLPLYRGEKADPSGIYNDLKSYTSSSNQTKDEVIAINTEATNYLSEELFLSRKDFIRIILTSQNTEATAEDWDEVYTILELAQRKSRNEALPSPFKEELINIYAQQDAKANAFGLFDEEEDSYRFKTFGQGETGSGQPCTPARIGFALSSPLLVLNEGLRQITTTIAFDQDIKRPDDLKKILQLSKSGPAPLLFHLTTEKEWIKPDVQSMSFGDFKTGEAIETYAGSISGGIMTKTSGTNFNDTDIGKYMVWGDGLVYEIITVNSTSKIALHKVGSTEGTGKVEKFHRGSIYLCSLQVTLQLQEDEKPIGAIDPSFPDNFINSTFPVLAITINNIIASVAGQKRYVNQYQNLMALKMAKVHLDVNVTGMRENALQNDLSNINSKKPFEPFGYQSEIGNSFYFANPEICYKKIRSLELDVQWMKAPTDFVEHYKNYWLVQSDNPNLATSEYDIKSNDDFKGSFSFYDNRTEVTIGELKLFAEEGKISIQDLPGQIKEQTKSYNYKEQPDYEVTDEVLNWDRYFRLELIDHDFQHDIYNGLLSKQALSKNEEIKKLNIKAPYTPKLKAIRFGYTASAEIVCGDSSDDSYDRMYHIQPFGFNKIHANNEDVLPFFLPPYDHEGELMVGINNLITPQTLSILFQMAEGSANPDVQKPEIVWSYLKNNEWEVFKGSSILSDTTNGFTNTGIIKFEVSNEITCNDTLLPGTLHWIKATCEVNTSGISDSIDILAQAVSATFCSEEVSASHFDKPLLPESIKTSFEPFPEIKKIKQPYTSSKGKPAESDDLFYNRISERLRHKNRAITMWDYEHMVLEQFPEVYKVKCLPASIDGKASQLGTVDVIVIPDIKGKLPFNPFEPKVPADTIYKIQEYLNGHIPAFAEANVINPTYLQVKTRFAVKLKKGYNEGFYLAKLEEEIKRFLAPWAYDEGSDISIGGKIYSSVIVNFIAERPYVDYIARIKLFQSTDGIRFTDARALNNGQNIVVADKPDTILVSAMAHEIDIIDETGYDEDDFDGINYMRVELDFKIGEDLLI